MAGPAPAGRQMAHGLHTFTDFCKLSCGQDGPSANATDAADAATDAAALELRNTGLRGSGPQEPWEVNAGCDAARIIEQGLGRIVV